MSHQQQKKLPKDEYFHIDKIPESWFMPVSELNSDFVKEYMDDEGRKKTLKATLEAMVEQKQQERKGKGKK